MQPLLRWRSLLGSLGLDAGDFLLGDGLDDVDSNGLLHVTDGKLAERGESEKASKRTMPALPDLMNLGAASVVLPAHKTFQLCLLSYYHQFPHLYDDRPSRGF